MDKPAVRAIGPDDDRRTAVRMLSDRVLLRLPGEEGERKTKTGLLIPETAASVSKRCIWAETVSIGPHVRQVEVGDLVLILPETGMEVEIRGDEYLLVREREIHAVGTGRSDGHGAGLYL